MSVPKKSQTERQEVLSLPFPENLITEIKDASFFKGELKWPLSREQLDGLYHAINSLHERNRQFLLLRYRDHMMYRDIGKQMGVSRQRARQIVCDDLLKLVRWKNASIILDGYQSNEDTVR